MALIQDFFPLIIILFIWVIIGFYFGNKVKRHEERLVIDETRPKNSLTLFRVVEPTNYLRKYSVIVDGNLVGNIASGETKHFDLVVGKHFIVVTIDWCKSKPYAFEIVEGNNTQLNCGANYNNWKCMFMCAVKPSNWVYVKAP